MTLLDIYKCLSDESRLRIIAVLNHGIFNVQELTSILGLSQSTISHHLKTLQSCNIVKSEKDGTWAYYTLRRDNTSAPSYRAASGFLELLGDPAVGTIDEMIKGDLKSVEMVQARRRDKAKTFFDSVAPEWKHLRTEAQGDTSYMDELIRYLPSYADILELGCGSGALLERILPRKGKTIGVDYSEAMLDAARSTLGSLAKGVDFRLGYLEHLPIGDASVDLTVTCMVLHHLTNPREAIKDTWRVLKPGGEFLVVDLVKHEREEMREKYADLWLGFDPAEFQAWLAEEGFRDTEVKILGKNQEVFLLKSVKP